MSLAGAAAALSLAACGGGHRAADAGTGADGSSPPSDAGPPVGWVEGPPLRLPRGNRTALRLPSGRVVVAGGDLDRSGNHEVEVYDPGAGAWGPALRLTRDATNNTADLLAGGDVLITGGAGMELTMRLPVPSPSSDTCFLYDPATHEASRAASLAEGRSHHRSAVLGTGEVLVAGGAGTLGTPPDAVTFALASAELYDESSAAWGPTGPMAEARFDHTLTRLASGAVLAAGGRNDEQPALGSAELYDPGSGAWRTAAPMGIARVWHGAALLPSGRVLVAGGLGADGTPLASAELYDPVADRWSPAAPLPAPAADLALTVLDSGGILATGGVRDGSFTGSDMAAVYREDTDRWDLMGPLRTARSHHSAVQLPDGRVMVILGLPDRTGITATTELSEEPLR